jgi:predicted transcriptional regulator
MPKEVQMSIKMESELHDRFMVVAAAMDRPAAQIVRELMRAFISRHELPNADTIAAIEAMERGEMTTYDSVDGLYEKLGI